MIMIDVADLVVIAGQVLGTDPGAALDQLDVAVAQAALAEAYAGAKESADAQGLTNVTLDEVLAASGIPPNTVAEFGRFEAIETQFVKNANGGTLPSTTSGIPPTRDATTAVEHAIASRLTMPSGS